MLHNIKLGILFMAAILTAGKTGMANTQSVAGIVTWVVEKNSTLCIEGKSNVNSFSCSIDEYAKKDTIVCANDLSIPIRLSGEIQMDILNFNCHSTLITKDLRKTLKAGQYPTMTIRFLSLQSMPMLQHKTELIKGWVEVQLAGVVKRFELNYSFLIGKSGMMQLDGSRNFLFSDFKLSPPRKMAGLIKIKNDFHVNFHLNLRTL
jgi:hypothetical protein